MKISVPEITIFLLIMTLINTLFIFGLFYLQYLNIKAWKTHLKNHYWMFEGRNYIGINPYQTDVSKKVRP